MQQDPNLNPNNNIYTVDELRQRIDELRKKLNYPRETHTSSKPNTNSTSNDHTLAETHTGSKPNTNSTTSSKSTSANDIKAKLASMRK